VILIFKKGEYMDFVVYSKPNCPQCVQVKNILNAENIVYEERQIDHDNIEMLMEYTRSAPVVFIGGKFVDNDDILGRTWKEELDLSGIDL
jgi:glutaredoxin